MTTDMMNPVEHALMLLAEYFQSGTTRERSVQILDVMLSLVVEMTDAQRAEFNTRGVEMVTR